MSESMLMQVQLEFENKSLDRQVTKAYLLNNISTGLKNIFGEVGAGFPVELESFEIVLDHQKYKLVLTIPRFLATKIQASLTLQGFYHGDRCAYHVKMLAENLE